MSIWKPILNNYQPPLYRAIAESISDAIKSGELKPGDKLLPHRIMADELNVTIGTVARGYKLASEWGLVSSKIGRGSIIKNPDNSPEHFPIDINGSYIDMGFLKPVPTSDPELRKHAYEDTLRRIGRRWKNLEFEGYAPEIGHPLHREAGASLIKRQGIDTSMENIILTTGAQESFLLILSLLTKPGDSILVEETIFVAVKSLGNLLNLNLIGVQLDEEGLIPQALTQALKKNNATILFLSPTFQNPTASIMGKKRRQEIAEIANRNDLFIIESDPFHLFLNSPIPPITHYIPHRAAYVTTLSYSGSPEMRIGYMRVPSKKIPELQAVKRASSISGSMISGEIATHWINSGIIERLVQWQLNEIKVRSNSIYKILKGFTYQYEPNGMFLWLQLPEPLRAIDIALSAKDRNVIVLEAERFMIGRGIAPHAIRISVTSPKNQNYFENGLKIISELISRPRIASPSYM